MTNGVTMSRIGNTRHTMTELVDGDRPKQAPPRRQSVQSIKIGYALLDAMASARAPLSLGELAKITEMPPPKARRYLVSFLDCELVRQHGETGHYELGPMALRLGFAAMSRLNPIQKTVEGAKALSQELDRTFMVAVWSERGPVIVAWFDSPDIVACNLQVGSVLPIIASGSGKLFLTYLPRKTTQAVVDRIVAASSSDPSLGPPAGPSVDEIVEEIVEDVSRKRFAITSGDLLPGLHAICAPIFDSNGTIAAVLAEIHRKDDPTVVAGRSIDDIVISNAASISQQLGNGWQEEASPGPSGLA
jgi:DNA-binding IclR family transcriptional regulator